MVTPECNPKAGVALGSISEEAFADLCLRNWYEYNLIPYDLYGDAQRFYVYWCDEYIDPRTGTIYIMRQQMIDNHSPDFNGYIIFFNEWGYPGQCDATEQQFVGEFQWLKEHYPDAKIIIGNANGHDHLFDYRRLRYIHELITDAGYDWQTDIYGIGIHDYTLDNPVIAVENLRELQSEWGVHHPIYITEFVANDVTGYLDYYNSQDDILAWFWFLPCNRIYPEYTLLYEPCGDNKLTPMGEQMRAINRQISP